ncbi:hypothetical protein B0A48_13101 [Cryoendolithus antarcticus]|uniref:Uncharacterized protein n=1 Tax=Cryoendolithus antarcticus TaxID=1507870 RepID=A0A1V8SNS2_9PEZI|nr:hypothetical protein B0A48_13101 [Cryoendolithus antarcticus]
MFLTGRRPQTGKHPNAFESNNKASSSNDNVPVTFRTTIARSVVDKPLPPDPSLETLPGRSRLTPATSAPATLHQGFREIMASVVPARRESVGVIGRGWIAQECRGIRKPADWEVQTHAPSAFEVEVHIALEEVVERCRKEQGCITEDERRRRRYAVGYGSAYRVEERSSLQRRGGSYTIGDDPMPELTSFGISKQRRTVIDADARAGDPSPYSCTKIGLSASDFLPR